MTAIQLQQGTTSVSSPKLFLAFELGMVHWKLAFTLEAAQPPRLQDIRARDLPALLDAIARAKKKFGLAADAPVCCCYEAGRDGFWLHRWLLSQGIDNVVVDSASIEVNRRRRRAKSDRLDAVQLVRMLARYHSGEKRVWSVVRVPSEAQEDARQLHRELGCLQEERTRLTNSMKALLIGKGIELGAVTESFPETLATLGGVDGRPLSAEVRDRLQRSWERWRLVHREILDLEKARRQRIREEESASVDKVRVLMQMKGIGPVGAWMLVMELFAWRQFDNRKQLGALVGLTPTPFDSGQSRREQGISKAGNAEVRALLIELAWMWLRHQPNSELSRWYYRRFGTGKRPRKIGIVALARKLLIALWRLAEKGEIPPGAEVVDWRPKVTRVSSSAKTAATPEDAAA